MGKRFRTKYIGVSYRLSKRRHGDALDKIFYVQYKNPNTGKFIEESVGRESYGMTPDKANLIRGLKLTGQEPSNKDKKNALLEKNKVTLKYLWYEFAAVNDKRKSFKDDRGRVLHLEHLMDKPIHLMTTSDMDSLKRKLNKAPSTINQVISMVRRLINFGVNRGLCKPPENLRFKMLKTSNEKTEMLSEEQTERLLNVLNELGDVFEAQYLKLALYTGIRKNALLGLKWSDCDFENKIIHLSSGYSKSGDVGYIPMSNLAQNVLLNIRKTKSEFVFPDKNGNKRNDYNYPLIKKIYKQAGIEGFRPLHGLRHNFASRLASSGKVDLYTIQKMLTHKGIKMTQRYAHLRDEALKRAASVVDEEFMSISKA